MTTEGRTVSTRARILGWYVLLLAVALVAALLLQRAFLLRQVEGDVDVALDQEASEFRQLAGGIDPATGQPFAGDIERIFEVFLSRNVPLEGEGVVAIIDGRVDKADVVGAELARSALADEWLSVTTPTRRESVIEVGPVRWLGVPIEVEGRPQGLFVVAILMRPRLDAVGDAIGLAGAVYGSIFVIASALAWVAAGGVLRPLRDLQATAGSISESDLSRRIPVSGDDEIARLGRTFNAMLDRLADAFATQRRFVDDAGHELRTPITVIRGNLEVMADDPADREATMRLVTAELDRMSRIVDDLLLLAKSDAREFIDPHPLDVGTFTDDLLARAAIVDRRPWTLDGRAEVVVDADEQRLTQAMMNLVENVARHTPRGAPAWIGSRVADDVVVLSVRDSGPGIPDDPRPLFERFSRGTAGRASDGAGLGLAIVDAVAAGHGGEVVARNVEGGAVFEVMVPFGGHT